MSNPAFQIADTSQYQVHVLPDTDPLLRTISQPVTVFNFTLRYIADQMDTAMTERAGLGLAAVQIGYPVRLILIKDRDTGTLTFMANPVVTRKLRRDAIEREGCLSVPPSKWRNIARPAKCEAEWQDLDGKPQSGGFSNWLARAVMHEVEHLDGILITDYPDAR